MINVLRRRYWKAVFKLRAFCDMARAVYTCRKLRKGKMKAHKTGNVSTMRDTNPDVKGANYEAYKKARFYLAREWRGVHDWLVGKELI